jgi:hypothetical protein
VQKSTAVEGWFARTKPPSEAALRRVRDIILGADPSMRERIQYGITFSSTKSGDFAAFVRYQRARREPQADARRPPARAPSAPRGGAVKRMRIADVRQASARASELRSIATQWCALGDAARAKAAAKRPNTH